MSKSKVVMNSKYSRVMLERIEIFNHPELEESKVSRDMKPHPSMLSYQVPNQRRSVGNEQIP